MSGAGLTPDVSDKVGKIFATPPAPPDKAALAPGWQAVKTDAGKTYFYHAATKKTTWIKPIAAAMLGIHAPKPPAEPRPPVGAKPSKPKPSLPLGWKAIKSPEGKTYYYNKGARRGSCA